MKTNILSALIPTALVAAAAISLATPAQAVSQPLTVSIYNGFNDSGTGAPFSDLYGTFMSPDIMFATNTGYNWTPYGLHRYGADICGQLNVAGDGTYAFALNSDDGSGFFVDGVEVLDDSGPHSPKTVSGPAYLSAGLHPFEVQFFEDFGAPGGVDLSLPEGVTYAPCATPEPGATASIGFGVFGIAGMVFFAKRRRTGSSFSL